MKIFIGLIMSGLFLYAEQFGVFVGIDNYVNKKEPTALVGAKNDIEAFRTLLQEAGMKKENTIVLRDEQATKHNIQNALIALEKKMQKGRGDRFYYFHAGHGSRLTSVGLDNISLSQTAVLLPYDFDAHNANSYLLTSRDMKPLFQKIDKKVDFGLLAFDSCYAEAATRSLSFGMDEKRYQKRYFSGKITVDNAKMKLVHSTKAQPYKHIVALSSSKVIETSKEDKILKRGVFSMALERCMQEELTITEQSLKECLDREYTIQKYVYTTPTNTYTKNVVFKNKTIEKTKKLWVYTTIKLKQLKSLKNIARFTDKVNSGTVLELKKSSKGYVLSVSPSGDMINDFKTIEEVKQFISNYRVIRFNTQGENGVDMRVTYDKAPYKDNDTIPSLMDVNVSIESQKEGYLALFSLSSLGKLYMIYPVVRYEKLKDTIIVKMETTNDVGTEFLKAMVFDKPNRLAYLKVDAQTGEVLNDAEQIKEILFVLNKSSFNGMTRKITTFKKQ